MKNPPEGRTDEKWTALPGWGRADWTTYPPIKDTWENPGTLLGIQSKYVLIVAILKLPPPKDFLGVGSLLLWKLCKWLDTGASSTGLGAWLPMAG